MGPSKRIRCVLSKVTLLALGVCLDRAGLAQSSGQTIRHHRVAEDSAVPPEITQAEVAIDKKDYATAEPLLRKAVAANPENYQAWFDLGFVYNGLGNTQDSIAAYRKSVAAKPDVFESNLNLGLMLVKTGQPDAEPYLRAATTLKPTANVEEGHERAWLALARVLESSKPEDAIEAYRQAAVIEPKDSEPHLYAGALLEKENHFADAEQEYKQALAINPGSGDALTGLANVYLRGNRLADAEAVLLKLDALQPNDAGVHRQLGHILAAAGKDDEAIAQMQTAAKLAPSPDVFHDLADLYYGAKKYDLAEAQYRTLVAANPNDAELHYGLGAALLKQRKFPEAQQEFLAAIKLKPDMGVAYGDLAITAIENKNYELAIKAADARARFLPEIPVSFFLRASAYDHLHDYKMAAQNYHRFLELANGQYPDEEWKARHRLITIEPKK
jgi:tetratricopeptide (TPR) repeat protein